ncbi:MAG: SEC59/DGK1/VTE5 family protein [Euryarchaeota archaeon]|nr:SEC59/DGK1/VTE5 family protein [Euryarchaeota archaeon]
MSDGDLLGLLLVYAYVGILVIVASKWKFLKRTNAHRKFIHVMIGNITIFWWIFETNWMMSLLAAAPFIPLLYILTKEGSRKDMPENKLEREVKRSVLAEASVDGHKLGLVYYAISWTILAFFSFDDLMLASIGIVCMAYGDGMGGLIGKRFGKRKIHGCKTLEGTVSVFIFAAIACFAIFSYYGFLNSEGYYMTSNLGLPSMLALSVGIAAYVAVVELYTPGEYDNLVIPLSTVLILTLLGV